MINKSPQETGSFRQRIRFMQAARIGFHSILKHLDFGPSDTILLPAYIGITDNEGSGVMDPVIEVSAKPEFYPVNRYLSADIDFIENRIAASRIKALLVIHYFGFAQNDMKAVRALCDRHDVILIEDCAHAWCSSLDGVPLGEFGQYSFGSIHKYLPAPDGGFVKWQKRESFRSRHTLEKEISTASLIEYTSADYPAIASIRLRNYTYLADQLKEQDGVEVMFPQLMPGITPLNFPILITAMSREKLYFDLINKGLTLIALYYRLIPEIDEKSFPVPHQITKNILNLPVHQDTTIDDLTELVETMKDILKKNMRTDMAGNK